jgi:hypothetical protein
MRDPPVSGAVLGDKGIRYQGHREGSFFQVIPGCAHRRRQESGVVFPEGRMLKFAEGRLARLPHEFSNKAHCPTTTRAPASSSSVSLSSTGRHKRYFGRCLAGRGSRSSSFAIACCNRFPILPAATTVSSLRRCSEIPRLRPCCRILRIFRMKCRSSNPWCDLLAALRFIRVFAFGSRPAIRARGGRGLCFRRGVEHDWLACTTGGVPPALWARAGAKGLVGRGGKTCSAWRRTPPLNLSAAILARSGWWRSFEQTTRHMGMGTVTIWRPRRAHEIAQDSSNPMDRDSSWNQQRLQIFLAVSSFLPRFLPEFQVLVTKSSRYRIVLPGDRPSFNGVHRDVKLFSRAHSRQPIS